jgi:hypothetical protein
MTENVTVKGTISDTIMECGDLSESRSNFSFLCVVSATSAPPR